MENLNSRLNVMITALNKIQSEISQIKENAGKTTQGKMQEKIDYFSRRTNKLLSENGFENDEKLNGNYSNCDINEESGNECNYRDCGEDDEGESCVRGYKGCQNNIGEGRESKVNKNSYENIKEKRYSKVCCYLIFYWFPIATFWQLLVAITSLRILCNDSNCSSVDIIIIF